MKDSIIDLSEEIYIFSKLNAEDAFLWLHQHELIDLVLQDQSLETLEEVYKATSRVYFLTGSDIVHDLMIEISLQMEIQLGDDYEDFMKFLHGDFYQPELFEPQVSNIKLFPGAGSNV